jgi:hypothetical protein
MTPPNTTFTARVNGFPPQQGAIFEIGWSKTNPQKDAGKRNPIMK